MKVSLPYGRSAIDVHVPSTANVTLIQKKAGNRLRDPRAEVQRALANPVGALPLSSLGSRYQTACILVCDITRPVPNRLFLQPLIDQLERADIPKRNIKILIATGLHRPAPASEIHEILGDAQTGLEALVENHDARAAHSHIEIGVTSAGTRVKLDRRFVEADLKIATGLVEPHFMAGYSGGRKVIAPGIAHADTIRALHSARILEHPAAAQCNLTDNPLHLEQLEILALLRNRCLGKPIYSLNTVVNDKRELLFVNFGDIEASHEQAVVVAHDLCTVPVEKRFPIILTSGGGFPLDQTYYQTVKAMLTPLDVAEENATLIVASQCGEGFGSSDFTNSQRRLVEQGDRKFLDSLLAKPLADIDEWESEMQLKAQRKVEVKVHATGLSPQERKLTGVEHVDSVETSVAEAMSRSRSAEIAVIPEGPYVIPKFVNYSQACLH